MISTSKAEAVLWDLFTGEQSLASKMWYQCHAQEIWDAAEDAIREWYGLKFGSKAEYAVLDHRLKADVERALRTLGYDPEQPIPPLEFKLSLRSVEYTCEPLKHRIARIIQGQFDDDLRNLYYHLGRPSRLLWLWQRRRHGYLADRVHCVLDQLCELSIKDVCDIDRLEAALYRLLVPQAPDLAEILQAVEQKRQQVCASS